MEGEDIWIWLRWVCYWLEHTKYNKTSTKRELYNEIGTSQKARWIENFMFAPKITRNRKNWKSKNVIKGNKIIAKGNKIIAKVNELEIK